MEATFKTRNGLRDHSDPGLTIINGVSIEEMKHKYVNLGVIMNSALEYTTSGTRALEPISVVIRVVAVMAEGERKLEGSHK